MLNEAIPVINFSASGRKKIKGWKRPQAENRSTHMAGLLQNKVNYVANEKYEFGPFCAGIILTRVLCSGKVLGNLQSAQIFTIVLSLHIR